MIYLYQPLLFFRFIFQYLLFLSLPYHPALYNTQYLGMRGQTDQELQLFFSVFNFDETGNKQSTILGLGQVVLSLGQVVPSLGQAVPSLGQAIPSLGQVVPSLGQVVPNLGQVVPSMGQVVQSLGQVVPSSGRTNELTN